MKTLPATLPLLLLSAASLVAPLHAEQAPAHLPGELDAEQVLNGEYPFPASPASSVTYDSKGIDATRIGKVPPPGVHPRILVSPDQLPDLRTRLQQTNVGKALYATLQTRLDKTIRDKKTYGGQLYDLLAKGDKAATEALIKENKGLPPGIGHYQPYLYAIVMEAFDALITENADRGKAAATAVATYSELILPGIEQSGTVALHDDVWRAKLPDSPTTLNLRDGVGGHLLGYAYDFSFPYMTEAQRAVVRKTIATATRGKLWMGGRLPHHFRNWNWVAVGLQQPTLALAIEGEDGYDPRVYKLGVDIARDYLTYGISPEGTSTEAVGYTQFGLVWGNPFFVAAQRRGENLLGHSHHRNMLDWYLRDTVPTRDQWQSSGDGGDGSPAIWTLSMWRYFYPEDPKAEAVWRSFLIAGSGTKAFAGNFHIIEPMLWAAPDPKLTTFSPQDTSDLKSLNAPLTNHDTTRGIFTSRSGWGTDDAWVQFECRTDSVGASHEHADRGNFKFAALGRLWAKDNFRSIETRHHNSILIDGKGQGFWPGPGEWLGYSEKDGSVTATVDMKDNYGWFWPKQITTEPADTFIRFQFPRWEGYKAQSIELHKRLGDLKPEPETRPGVVAFWKGFEKTGPRLWDEDSMPVRVPFNPVQRANRAVLFNQGPQPFLLIADEIQKDDQEHLYEWLMQTGPNTEIASIKDGDIILCDGTVKRDVNGMVKPAKGDRQLLVRVLQMNDPARLLDFQTRPSARLETFERRDTLDPTVENGKPVAGRTYGLDKRLVIPSRSVSPSYRILLFPFRNGSPLPVTTWDEKSGVFTIDAAGSKKSYRVEDRGTQGLQISQVE